MGYKYRNGSTPDHVNSADSNSTANEDHGLKADTTGISPNPRKNMSDSLRNDETRLDLQIKAGNPNEAAKVAERQGKTIRKYLVGLAESDSASAAKRPAQMRKELSAPDVEEGDGASITSPASARKYAKAQGERNAVNKARNSIKGQKPD